MANKAIEKCDYATVLGNSFTINTYSYAGKLIFPLPIPTPFLFDRLSDKNFASCRKNFLWFGSEGLVHKGLDLALEAFCQLPEFSLIVCGPLDKEPDFVEAYYKELYQTPNITAVGWIDIKSDAFRRIIDNCVGLIYPSCSEGQAGAVITCMQAGLIPVVSYESGVDVNDYGVLLQESSVEEIIKTVTALSRRTISDLQGMAERAQFYCRVNHVGENYLKENKKIIKKILELEAAKCS
jgi:glycosyltransferase involved in cell wall biosynthesis